MNKWIFSILVLGLVLACGNAGDEKSGTPQPKSSQKTAEAGPDGSKIYKQYCVTCHGLYGDMGASGAFNLQTSALNVEERMGVIAKGRNVMTGFETILNEDKIRAVAEYTMTLKSDD